GPAVLDAGDALRQVELDGDRLLLATDRDDLDGAREQPRLRADDLVLARCDAPDLLRRARRERLAIERELDTRLRARDREVRDLVREQLVVRQGLVVDGLLERRRAVRERELEVVRRVDRAVELDQA